jgi:hypothetical protein
MMLFHVVGEPGAKARLREWTTKLCAGDLAVGRFLRFEPRTRDVLRQIMSNSGPGFDPAARPDICPPVRVDGLLAILKGR